MDVNTFSVFQFNFLNFYILETRLYILLKLLQFTLVNKKSPARGLMVIAVSMRGLL